MAERSSSNVVSLRSQEPASEATPALDSAPLLAGCRDRLANGLSTLFAQHLGDANENLLGMADRATSMEQQQLYFMALELLNKSNQRLLQGFRDSYVKAFDQAIGRLRGERSDSGATLRLPTELSLVDTEDFERDLAIGKLSARATFNCSQQLTALDRRLTALLRLSRIGQDDNPLYPRTLFTAMLDTLDAMGAGEQLGLVLVHEFERQTASELPGIYAELNRYLIDAGVLPKIPLAGSQQAPRAQSLDEGAGSHGRASAGSGAHQGMEGGGARSHEDVFAQLAQALQAGMAHQAQARGDFPILTPSLPTLSQPGSAGTGASVSGLIQALDQVQRSQRHQGPLSGLGQAQFDPHSLDVLRQIRATPIVNSSHPVDAMTIDIVSMLFGAIFNDPDLSAAMRAELARLQIPVVKVALLDKAFFSDRRHPARRLLDLIASSGIGRSEMDEPRLIDKIRALVDAIVDGFDADIGVFAAQTQKLEEFLKDEEARAQSKAARVLGDIAQRDRQVVAGGHVESELKSRLAHPELPDFIANFLDQHWRRVLVERFVHTGEDSDAWREALGAMDDLIWSVQTKDSAEERERLLARLPELIPRLRAGLAELDPAQDQEPFFSALLRLHMAVLNRTAPPAEASPEPTSEPVTPLTEPSAKAPEASAAAAATAPPSATRASELPEAPEEDSDRYSRLAQALDVGAWIEFQSFRGTRKTLRLSWVSQYRGVYLFTNRQGDNALTLAATSLASHLRNGTARLLSQDPLTERAVTQVLEQVGGDAGKTP